MLTTEDPEFGVPPLGGRVNAELQATSAQEAGKPAHFQMSSRIEKDEFILAIETATRAGSVAVARGGEVLATRVGDATISHSTNLIEMIESALNEARAELSDIALFAAAVGPGSFTGLRIGLATVKAFAAVTGGQIVGVSTLAAIAHAEHKRGEIVSLLPAGRGEVFAQMFSVDDGIVNPLDRAAHLSPKEVVEKYRDRPRVTFAGEGKSQLNYPLATASGSVPGGSVPAEDKSAICLAVSVAGLALKEYREGKSVTPDELHAVYVRASDAEINERWQQQRAQPQVEK
jgi:tRNA threonylcarbamoyladenosine biosynthesis protein TsaB